MNDEPFIRWDWIVDNLDEIARRVGEHVMLTVIAVVIGFLISFGLALLIRRYRRLEAPIVGVGGILYSIPSLALFAMLVPITGHPEPAHRRDRARELHDPHPAAQHPRGVRRRAT